MPTDIQEKKSQARHIFTVSQITNDIKLILENTFERVWVEGEISNFTKHTSGHFYFSLKDESNVLVSVMFSRANKDVKFKIENGMKVICYGKISAYGARSQYQIIVEKIEPKGIGALQLALEQLKEKLEKLGFFRSEHKKPIPHLPSRIGVVTSASGAAIKDILKVIDRRFADVEVIINPVQVQGENAKYEIAQAIDDFNKFNQGLESKERVEVLIVGRGGGSTEDLWAFNEEIVAKAIYNSKIPVISAVGHERDWTISDLVADLRAPTPSAAAEMVIPEKEELREKLDFLRDGLSRSASEMILDCAELNNEFLRRIYLSTDNILKLNESGFSSLAKKLALLNPSLLISQHKAKIIDLAKQIYVRTEHFKKLKDAEFKTLVEKLTSLSPLHILARGYSITFKHKENSLIKDSGCVSRGEKIRTKLFKGEIISRVTEVN